MKLSDSSPNLSVPRTSECVQSTSVNDSSSYSHSTPKVSKVTVQPQQPGNLEHQVNTINRSSSAVILSGSYLQQQAANKMKLSDSSPHLSVPRTSECVQSTSVNSSSYSHLFPGRFLHTMRKVSTSTDLPCPCNDEDMKPTLIHVKPIDTMEQI